MTRTHLPSIPQRESGDQPSLNRQLRRALARELDRLVAARDRRVDPADTDRYRKHFSTQQHLWLLLVHALSGSRSLRQTYAALEAAPELLACGGLLAADGRPSVSFSQLAASNTSRPATFVAGLLPELIARVQATGVPAQALPP